MGRLIKSKEKHFTTIGAIMEIFKYTTFEDIDEFLKNLGYNWTGLVKTKEDTLGVPLEEDFRYTIQLNIKDEIDSSKEAEFFQNIDYIVEFELVSNYYNTSPYYFNAGINNCVVVLKDGTMSLEGHSPLNSFRAAAYETDFSSFTESIEDFHGEYDRVLEIK